MVFITTDTWRKIGVEVIIVGNIKWLNKTNIEKLLGRVCFQNTTTKYSLGLENKDKN